MVEPISSGNINPMEMYKSECQRGADLFKKSLDKYESTKNQEKKYEFEKVIQDSLKVMNEACRGMKKEKALHQEEKLQKDFDDYKSQPTPEKLQQLYKEADDIKGSI